MLVQRGDDARVQQKRVPLPTPLPRCQLKGVHSVQLSPDTFINPYEGPKVRFE